MPLENSDQQRLINERQLIRVMTFGSRWGRSMAMADERYFDMLMEREILSKISIPKQNKPLTKTCR